MTTATASAILANPNAVGPVGASAKGVVTGFEALLAGLFAPPADGGVPTQTKSGTAPTKAGGGRRAGIEGDAVAGALQALSGIVIQANAPLAVTTPSTSAPQAGEAKKTAFAAQTPLAGEAFGPTASASGTPSAGRSAGVQLNIAAPDAIAATPTKEDHPAKAVQPATPQATPAAATPAVAATARAATAPTVAASSARDHVEIIAVRVATLETAPPTANAQAVLAETPAAEVAAVPPSPGGGGKAVAAIAKPDARPAGARTAATAPKGAQAEAPAKLAQQSASEIALKIGDDDLESEPTPPREAASTTESEPDPAQSPTQATTQTAATPQPAAGGPAALPARANAETVTRFAAQLGAHLSAKTTQFDIALEPAGLGKVDVRVQIAPDGALTAALAFATPHAAGALRARAAELQQALQQAGFDVSDGALSFDVAGQGGQRGHGQAEVFDAWQERTLRAFASLDEGPAALAAPFRRADASGVDIRI